MSGKAGKFMQLVLSGWNSISRLAVGMENHPQRCHHINSQVRLKKKQFWIYFWSYFCSHSRSDSLCVQQKQCQEKSWRSSMDRQQRAHPGASPGCRNSLLQKRCQRQQEKGGRTELGLGRVADTKERSWERAGTGH